MTYHFQWMNAISMKLKFGDVLLGDNQINHFSPECRQPWCRIKNRPAFHHCVHIHWMYAEQTNRKPSTDCQLHVTFHHHQQCNIQLSAAINGTVSCIFSLFLFDYILEYVCDLSSKHGHEREKKTVEQRKIKQFKKKSDWHLRFNWTEKLFARLSAISHLVLLIHCIDRLFFLVLLADNQPLKRCEILIFVNF